MLIPVPQVEMEVIVHFIKPFLMSYYWLYSMIGVPISFMQCLNLENRFLTTCSYLFLNFGDSTVMYK